MPPSLDKPRLRRVLRRLMNIRAFGEDAEIAQESLDFLALLAGIKPVYVLGRGFDDPAWVEGVSALATEYRLHTVEGPYWQPEQPLRGLPEWYVTRTRALIAAKRAVYVSKTRAIHASVAAACESAAPTVPEEARLLGYPECCVADHHRRVRAYHDATLMVAARRTGGETAAMTTLYESGEHLTPETGEERALAERVAAVRPGPFTSLNLCEPCARSMTSPGMRVVARFGDLAAAIDGDYFAILAD